MFLFGRKHPLCTLTTTITNRQPKSVFLCYVHSLYLLFLISLFCQTGSTPKFSWSKQLAYMKDLIFLRTFLGILSNTHYFTFHRNLPFCTVILAIKLFQLENPLDFFCLDRYNVSGMKFSQGKPKPL